MLTFVERDILSDRAASALNNFIIIEVYHPDLHDSIREEMEQDEKKVRSLTLIFRLKEDSFTFDEFDKQFSFFIKKYDKIIKDYKNSKSE